MEREGCKERPNPLNITGSDTNPSLWRITQRGVLCREKWWTWSQCIRTTSTLNLEFTLLETTTRPLYQDIAVKSTQLHRLGMSFRIIASKLNVDEKSVAKAIQWFANFDS